MEPSEWRERVGRQIEAARAAAGIRSMRAAARKAGFSEATWRQLESGRRQLAPGHVVAPTPRIDTLVTAAHAVGLSPSQLAADAGYPVQDIQYAEDFEHALQRADEGLPVQHRKRSVDELEMIWLDLSEAGKQAVMTFASELRNAEAHQLLVDVRSVLPASFAMAAHEGGEDDEVGPATTRPPTGSTPEGPAST